MSARGSGMTLKYRPRQPGCLVSLFFIHTFCCLKFLSCTLSLSSSIQFIVKHFVWKPFLIFLNLVPLFLCSPNSEILFHLYVYYMYIYMCMCICVILLTMSKFKARILTVPVTRTEDRGIHIYKMKEKREKTGT